MREGENEICAYCGEYMPPNDRMWQRPSFCPKLLPEQEDWAFVNLHAACTNKRGEDIETYHAQQRANEVDSGQ